MRKWNQTSVQYVIPILQEKVTFRRHIETVHEGKKPYNCSICDSNFSSKGDLRRHIEAVHKEKKPHICIKCDATFALKQTLKTHISLIHEKVKWNR